MLRKTYWVLLTIFICQIAYATTLTTNYSLNKPASGDTDWAAEINANWDTIDGQMKTNADNITADIATHAALASVHHTATTDTFVTNKDSHDHNGGDGATITHSNVGSQTSDDHHNEAHTIASHSDTTGTGAELNTLTDGSTTSLHAHAGSGSGGTSRSISNSAETLTTNFTALFIKDDLISLETTADMIVLGLDTDNANTWTAAQTFNDFDVTVEHSVIAGEVTVDDVAYGAGWNGVLRVPTQNAVYDQVELKAPITSPTFQTSINGAYLTASEIAITDGSKNIVSAAVATYPSLTELTYVKGVTSGIQAQIDGVGGGSPGGSTNQIQINSGGTFNGVSGLTFDTGSSLLSVVGGSTVDGFLTVSGGVTFSSLDTYDTLLLLDGSSLSTHSSWDMQSQDGTCANCFLDNTETIICSSVTCSSKF